LRALLLINWQRAQAAFALLALALQRDTQLFGFGLRAFFGFLGRSVVRRFTS
jgi:hypothetical protein